MEKEIELEMEIEKISDDLLLVKNVKIFITLIHKTRFITHRIKESFIYEDILFKSEKRIMGGYQYYKQSWDCFEGLLERVGERYNLNKNQFCDYFGLFKIGDILFKYPKIVSHIMNNDEYNDWLIEERNRKINEVLENIDDI